MSTRLGEITYLTAIDRWGCSDIEDGVEVQVEKIEGQSLRIRVDGIRQRELLKGCALNDGCMTDQASDDQTVLEQDVFTLICRKMYTTKCGIPLCNF
jgi:hypothetical protein